ncbi:ion channel protein Tsx [Shewanella intestini]|uniref:Ion channel protein Tsx n=1 Tax=Shewanella intestini TaxID=2017544 RepID=A0ABS5I1Z1_9GAMM|nr:MULTISPECIES: ion channel protein Tsx [Shewanella]MBR9728019.1 ion channel protein Tsx [Shewanella intestini]MRG36430.1 ion channel protein Tsx [Shewanella sp. XMDDZSB0408]
MNNKWLYAAILASVPTFASANDLVQWSDTSVTGLYGDNYKVDAEKQQTVTFESAGAFTYGDWFAFGDVIHFDNTDKYTYYAEVSPRFSINKIFDVNTTFGPIKDVSFATTLEQGRGAGTNFLYGVGLDLDIPFFSYFQLNTYKRTSVADAHVGQNNTDGWQLTPSYRIDIPVGNSNIVVDGYIDWVFASDDSAKYSTNFHFNPQIKYDLGQVIFNSKAKNKFLVGVEYDYWKNKYGIESSSGFKTNQNTFSIIAKYHF